MTYSLIHEGERGKIAETTKTDIEGFPEYLAKSKEDLHLREYLPALALLELGYYQSTKENYSIPRDVDAITINPSLKILKLSWKNLVTLFHNGDNGSSEPVPGEEFILIWREPGSGTTKVQKASADDLLVLKLIVEEIGRETIAKLGDISIGAVDDAVRRTVNKGLLLSPASKIRRDSSIFFEVMNTGDEYLVSEVFTLQWHITQTCDLHCKHCYDRSDRHVLELANGIHILDDMRSFCLSRNVRGHISFSGGNPLLYPYFTELYRAASERGFSTAILGNAASKKQVEELIKIQKPSHFQVSLEGLEEHNDKIRGSGYFQRVMDFLPMLKELEVYSMVMLTLTKDNMNQIIPLAELLRDKVDSFTFNRLSLVGEGANLHLPEPDEFRRFLSDYLKAAENNPVMRLKDNLINILLNERGLKPFGGCAGFGCGAAFNFITILPDGEVHACRKFPSPVGNLRKQSISEVYDSDLAQKYRSGAKACKGCMIRAVCGGCLAVAHSLGLNAFEERDPFCFINKSDRVR